MSEMGFDNAENNRRFVATLKTSVVVAVVLVAWVLGLHGELLEADPNRVLAAAVIGGAGGAAGSWPGPGERYKACLWGLFSLEGAILLLGL